MLSVLISLLVPIVVAVIVYLLLKWLVDSLGAPAPVSQVLNILLVLALVIFILTKILPLTGISI